MTLKEMKDAEVWLRAFAERWNFDYGEMISEACSPNVDNGLGYSDHFVVARDIDLHDKSELGEDHDLFWFHLEKLTGQSFDPSHKDQFGWSCSC